MGRQQPFRPHNKYPSSSTSWGFAGPTHKIDEGDVNIDFLVIKAQLPPTKGHRGCATGSRERNGVHRPHPMARVSPVRLSPPCQAFGLAHTHNSASPLPRCSMCQLQTASTRLLRSANRVRRALSLCNGLTFLASETSKARAETKNGPRRAPARTTREGARGGGAQKPRQNPGAREGEKREEERERECVCA